MINISNLDYLNKETVNEFSCMLSDTNMVDIWDTENDTEEFYAEAATFYGVVYNIYHKTLHRYVNVLHMGVDVQNLCDTYIDKEKSMERAVENAMMKPVIVMYTEQYFCKDAFVDLATIYFNVMHTCKSSWMAKPSKVYKFSTINQNRNSIKHVCIDGRQYDKYGIEQAVTFAGSLYKSDNTKDFVLRIGLSKQHPSELVINKNIAYDTAIQNVINNPVMTVHFDNYMGYLVFKEFVKLYLNTMKLSFVKTRQENKKA